jgi:hypothetical protein
MRSAPDVEATILVGWERTSKFPLLTLAGNLTISLAAALATYEVIEASKAERDILGAWGYPFGGVQ